MKPDKTWCSTCDHRSHEPWGCLASRGCGTCVGRFNATGELPTRQPQIIARYQSAEDRQLSRQRRNR